MAENRADLVLEGGGVKGIGHVGAVARLIRDYKIERVAGSSAGALVGVMVAVGGTADELRDELFDFPFHTVPAKDLLDRLPIIGPLLSVVFERGIYQTSELREYLALRLAERGVSTWADLRYDDPKSALPPAQRYRLVVTVTDLTSGELLYLPWDYHRLGLDPDEQSVADAVVASCAIPFYFEPSYLTDQNTGKRHILVDGGTLSNYPITVFDRTDGKAPRWPTFGQKLIPRLPEFNRGTLPLIGRIPIPGLHQMESLIATMIVGRDQTYLSRPCVASRTMQIDTAGVNAIGFDVSLADKDLMYEHGWDAADQFLKGWDWQRYLRECRGSVTR